LRLRNALKNTDVLLTATKETKHKFLHIHSKDSYYIPENGTQGKFSPLQSISEKDVINLVWIGTIDHRKALKILIEAISKIDSDREFKLRIIGDGHLKEEMRLLSITLGVHHYIDWLGKIPRDKVMQCMKDSHLHVLTSLSEANTSVLLEAFSAGIPTLTIDHCGMSDLVNDGNGFKVPVDSYASVVESFASTLTNCLNNPEEIDNKAAGVYETFQQLNWSKRECFFNKLYEDVYRS
jgi:glycosyltransferase involved in cell wall biosynthesis